MKVREQEIKGEREESENERMSGKEVFLECVEKLQRRIHTALR